MKHIALLLVLSSCSSAPTHSQVKPEYQNTFFIGCMNGQNRWIHKAPTKEMANWCKKKYEQLRYK